MNSLILALSAVVDKQKVITDLRDSINLALQNPEDEDIYDSVLFHSKMVLFKHINDTDPDIITEIRKNSDFSETAILLKGLLKK
jgi:hypothetical protein